MSEHRIGTREEWQVARDELARLEAEQAERNEEIKSKRLDLPWVPAVGPMPSPRHGENSKRWTDHAGSSVQAADSRYTTRPTVLPRQQYLLAG
jgi:hypothetical protein